MPETVPVISLAPILAGEPGADAAVARAMEPALRHWGAFELEDHGVPPAARNAALAAAARFFEQDLETRLALKVDKANRGYVPMHQTRYEGNLPDLKESFNLGLPLTPDDPDVIAGKKLHAVNRWPSLPGFRQDVEQYFEAMAALGDRLLGPLAVCMDMPSETLRARYRKPIAFMRLFHYPPDSRLAEGEHGAAEHTDYGFLTILTQDGTGGFEVRTPSGAMAEVPPRPEAFLVNAGDMLAEIMRGAFRSAPHRVVNRSGIGRYSIPFFYDPDFDARFAGLSVSAGEFLLAKFNRFYAYRKSVTS